jgi:YfiH family protein
MPFQPIEDIPFLTSQAFEKLPVRHGFFGRRGGVSTGVYESLTAGFSCGDDSRNVLENRARIAQSLALDPLKLFSVQQCHGNACIVVDGHSDTLNLAADAMVTTTPGLGLGILTADCAPVLLAADGVVGAAHAGWGGALNGVLENTVEAMEKLGAARAGIVAAIGPCIGMKSYEVSVGFEKVFLAEDSFSECFFKSAAKPDKFMFDLAGYCAYRLARAGVRRVDIKGVDTLANPEHYFSHRRTTLEGGRQRGLQLSVIALNPA